jgi:aspartate/methionine/tyrosine aminotransferase
MTTYQHLTAQQRRQALKEHMEEYAAYQARNLSLNMARGKPAPEQLELSAGLLDVLSSRTDTATLRAGASDDYRNYGGLTGTPEARALMAGILDQPPELVFVLGNSSLQIMYDAVARAMTHGVLGSEPWATRNARSEASNAAPSERFDKTPGKLSKETSGAALDTVDAAPSFVCPVPGYDRHFALTEHFGICMIPVPLRDDGPDMDIVESLVGSRANIKGIWCVPKYANPTGIVYSEETVRRLATMPTAAVDFRIYWDNAYAVHDLVPAGESAPLANLRLACEAAGNPDRWYMFASTSKITFAGAGIAAFAASEANLTSVRAQMTCQTIGPDKLNQLRHTLFLRDLAGVRAHMRRHAAIIAPKFACVLDVLDARLGGLGIGEWTRPQGGYFISFEGLPGTARRVVALAKEAGVALTDAGATWPYGQDPADTNIRLAPTYPSVKELRVACELFALCVKVASLEVLQSPEYPSRKSL